MESTHLHAFCLHHDIGTRFNQKPLGPGGSVSSPALLVTPSASITVQHNTVPREHHCWMYGPGRNQDKPSVTSCLAPAIERLISALLLVSVGTTFRTDSWLAR
jgi:hypothetical protein